MSIDTQPTTGGLGRIPLSLEPLNRKDFVTDQEVRWCPGCGDYAILAAFLGVLPELGIKRENTVVVSGIGCSSRFPYYVNSYGMHSIHGRATAIATGVATAREDLAVFVITGDGDALSIGGNHLIHALRRNVNLTIVLFNNRIYGLTKGQYSPTSEVGKVTKSSPMGSVDQPFDPVALALGAGATFVARSIDSDRAHLSGVLKAAAAHRGTSLVEVYQNCPIFNDDAFAGVKGAAPGVIPLIDGEPVVFGPEDAQRCVVRNADATLSIVDRADAQPDSLLIHDAHRQDPALAFALTQLTDAGELHTAPIGIFRDVERPAYDDLVRDQVRLASAATTDRDAALEALLAGGDTWDVL